MKAFLLTPSLMFAALIVPVQGCSSSRGVQETTEKQTEPMQLGWVERAVLHGEQYAWFESGYALYTPNLEILEGPRSDLNSVHFLIVFGTWCSDSKRELPRFFKILDQLHVPDGHVRLFAVDRSKQFPPGIPQEHNITLVPTIIVLHGDREIGRIVESPKTTLEMDLADILTSLSP